MQNFTGKIDSTNCSFYYNIGDKGICVLRMLGSTHFSQMGGAFSWYAAQRLCAHNNKGNLIEMSGHEETELMNKMKLKGHQLNDRYWIGANREHILFKLS